MSKSIDLILGAVKSAGEAALRLYDENTALTAENAALRKSADDFEEIYHQLYMVLHNGGSDPYLGALEQATAIIAERDALRVTLETIAHDAFAYHGELWSSEFAKSALSADLTPAPATSARSEPSILEGKS